MWLQIPDRHLCVRSMSARFQYYYNSGVIMVRTCCPISQLPDADFNDLVVEYDLKTVECHAEPTGRTRLQGDLSSRSISQRRQRPDAESGSSLDFDLADRASRPSSTRRRSQGCHHRDQGRRLLDRRGQRANRIKVIILFDGVDKSWSTANITRPPRARSRSASR